MPHDEQTSESGGSVLAAALAYARAGLFVFPVRARSKAPATRDGFKSATTDAGQIREWWQRWPDAGVAIRTGRESGVVALDVDVQHGGGATLKALEREHGALPETARTLTGSGGNHYLFRHPGGELRSSSGALGPGLDVRADGGYIVVPPSVHENGRAYQWLRPLERGIADVPALLRAAERRRNGASVKVDEIIPEGKRRAAMLKVAGKLKRSGLTGDEIIPTLRELNKRCRPPLDERELKSVAYESTIEPAERLGVPAYTGPARELAAVVESFRRWLYLPDAGALYVTLATVAANRMPGDPVWLLLVAASSSGKTEVLLSLDGLDEIVPAATLSEAALLSGVPGKDHAKNATGGLLRKVGDYGIVRHKDFGSVLSLHPAQRAQTLAALRECYDGSWDRPLGVDGGKVLHWEGKLGLVAGVTTVVDRHHAVLDSLGSRFAFYRIEIEDREAQTRRALKHRRGVRAMRDELRDAVSGLFAGIQLPEDDSLDADDHERLTVLGDLVTRARSPVERDSYSREIELVPDPEAPARFALMLASLLEGLRAIGVTRAHAWDLARKVAFDSMPAQRRRLLRLLGNVDETTTKNAALELGLPTTTTRRALEDLAAHALITRHEGAEGSGDVWRMSPEIRDKYTASAVPGKSQEGASKYPHHANDDFPGTGSA